MSQLKPGLQIKADDQRSFQVVRFLGGGTQGDVYLVNENVSGKQEAFKLYHSHSASALSEDKIRALTELPSPGPRFLWPETVAHTDQGYGYIMKLRPDRFKSINDLLARKTDTSWYVLARVGMELADSFQKLHLHGLRYCDISPNNIFFDPNTGETLICDNDNVDIDGQPLPPVIGTPRFIAPELVRGGARPSRTTDLFSLAVMLFYLYVLHHPLEGQLEANIRCFDEPAQKELYGNNPVFIYDPTNLSNRPVPGLHDNALSCWPLLPKFLQDLFIRSFTEGLNQPDRRVEESVWRKEMSALRDLWFACPNCEADQFADRQRIEQGIALEACWNCSQTPALPLRMQLETGSIILLHPQSLLCEYHLDMHPASMDASQVIGTVNIHPQDKTRIGLKNLSQSTWIVNHMNETAYVQSGETLGVQPGMIFTFGSVKGIIK